MVFLTLSYTSLFECQEVSTTNSDITEGVTITDLSDKVTNSDIDSTNKDTNSYTGDTTISDLTDKVTNSDLVEKYTTTNTDIDNKSTTSSDLVEKITTTDLIEKSTNSDLFNKVTNSDLIEKPTNSDSIDKVTNSDIVDKDTINSDLINKVTNSDIVDTTNLDSTVKITISDLTDTPKSDSIEGLTSTDLSDKISNSDKVNTTNSDLTDKTTISDLTEEVISTDLVGNNTYPELVDEIAFRQVSHFKIKKELKIIIFFFFGVVSKPIKRGAYMKIKTHLTKDDDKSVEQEATCKVREDVNLEDGEQKQADLECEIDVEKPEEYDGLEVVSSESISGIPTEPNLLNPAKVDELIEIGDIKNYSQPENKEETIPVFNATSLDTNGSEETGIFYINGEVPPKFELKKNIEFELILLTGQKVICTIPRVNQGKKEIRIECVLQEELKGNKIMISPCAAFDGYNEIIRLNKIETEEPKNMPNGKENKLIKKFELDLSFGQLSGFAPRTNFIFFYFVGFVGRQINKGHIVKMMVNLLKNGLPVEQEANCTAIEDVNPEEKGQGQVQFDCKVDNVEKPDEFEGLELVSSEDINGIPDDPELLNPAKVDELIKEDKIENYTSQEFKNETIPVFNATSLDTNNSNETGIFYINGIVPPTFESKKKIEFEVILLSGEKAICTLPKITKNKNEIKIECVLQEVLKDTKIYIQSFSACEGYKQVMRFNKIESDKKVNIANGREYKIHKLFNIDLLFGQLSRFPKEREVTFDDTTTLPVATRDSNDTFFGWFTEPYNGIKIANANGTLVGSVEGYTDASGNWKYANDITLYAHYSPRARVRVTYNLFFKTILACNKYLPKLSSSTVSTLGSCLLPEFKFLLEALFEGKELLFI